LRLPLQHFTALHLETDLHQSFFSTHPFTYHIIKITILPPPSLNPHTTQSNHRNIKTPHTTTMHPTTPLTLLALALSAAASHSLDGVQCIGAYGCAGAAMNSRRSVGFTTKARDWVLHREKAARSAEENKRYDGDVGEPDGSENIDVIVDGVHIN
jgi:hypothetical protein